MRDPSFYVSSLLELADANASDRRGLWRQAMAALSNVPLDGGPGPLEALHPAALVKAAQAALASGLVDDLDFLSQRAAGVALYSLASVLPLGSEQRELGRRVLARMLAGNAETFTAMATIMAQTAGRGLSSPPIHARVALVTELPLSHAIQDGALAFALAGRREYARDWVLSPSTRSLPARRLSAKLLERAAREAARRAQLGDPHGLRIFRGDTVRVPYRRLLADRESLVWRYVAIARGICAGWLPELVTEIQDSLREGLTPTEWRRAATSLAAYGAVNPEEALKLVAALVKRGFFTREDPGSASAFMWGIGRTIEAEPDAAAKMLDAVLAVAPPGIAEAVCDLRREHGPSKIVDEAAERAIQLLRDGKAKMRTNDDGAEALFHEISLDLENASRPDVPVRHHVAEALGAFVADGAHAAYALARKALSASRTNMDTLEAMANDEDAEDRTGALARRASMAVLRDLDASLLECDVVANLLKLGGSSEQARANEDSLDALRERLAEWIVVRETPAARGGRGGAPTHATLRLRRLRALLHLVDGELGEGAEAAGRGGRGGDQDALDVHRGKRLRTLWTRTVDALLRHFDGNPSPVLKRTLLAALARALDALVRLGVCDVADALLTLATRLDTVGDFEALAEASMDPDLRHVLSRYARFLAPHGAVRLVDRAPDSSSRESMAPLTFRATGTGTAGGGVAGRAGPESAIGAIGADGADAVDLDAIERFANALAPEPSARVEALRMVLVRMHAALAAVATATSLRAVSGTVSAQTDVLTQVETWVSALVQMCLGARGRLDFDAQSPPSAVPAPKQLSQVVARALSGAQASLDDTSLSGAIDELFAGVPPGIARRSMTILKRLAELPAEPPAARESPSMQVRSELPPWLSARRTIGGFYVVRALGVGGTASVFVVNRMEDRHESDAERFALKVPEYTATAARSVSQEEFFKLFRDEASALIMLPNHANLARFVTFDLAARPLPILVMELVEGVTLERVITTKTFDTARCLRALDDVLAGLEAMHAVGVGHLDIKPSNVLLRKGEQAVLVDFGLAGRKIRPGCGTGPYGAPEVWGIVPEGHQPQPMAADIYSFGCLAFEMLTGAVLFDAPNEVTQITMHVSHDGSPPPVRALLSNPEASPIAEVLVKTLRRDPRQRPTAEELRRDIRAIASMVNDAPWPLGERVAS